LTELRIRNLALTGGQADLLLRRFGGEVAVTVARRIGDVQVVAQR